MFGDLPSLCPIVNPSYATAGEGWRGVQEEGGRGKEARIVGGGRGGDRGGGGAAGADRL